VLFVGMGLGVLSSIMFAAPLLTALKDREPRIKTHTARVLARRAAVRSGDVAPRGERKRSAATKTDTEPPVVPDDEVPALAGRSKPTASTPTASTPGGSTTGGSTPAGSAPRPGSRPTGKRNTNRGGRPGGNRPSGGSKRR
jgi:preprotein translocase subunit SecF